MLSLHLGSRNRGDDVGRGYRLQRRSLQTSLPATLTALASRVRSPPLVRSPPAPPLSSARHVPPLYCAVPPLYCARDTDGDE